MSTLLTLNHSVATSIEPNQVLEEAFSIVNAFCPTGEGGGQDNSCSSKEGGEGAKGGERYKIVKTKMSGASRIGQSGKTFIEVVDTQTGKGVSASSPREASQMLKHLSEQHLAGVADPEPDFIKYMNERAKPKVADPTADFLKQMKKMGRTPTQNSAETLSVNVTGKTRRETLHGREYLVAPVRMIVEGVLNGSKGALFYPRSEFSRDPAVWNGMPLVRNHPTDDNGNHVSARSKNVLEKFGLGMVLEANVSKGHLDAEAWFDVEQTKRVDNELYKSLAAGKPVELSTGLFTENSPAKPGATYNGKPYQFIARNYRPDHLAILPDQKGACSLNDGCGVLVNEEEGKWVTISGTPVLIKDGEIVSGPKALKELSGGKDSKESSAAKQSKPKKASPQEKKISQLETKISRHESQARQQDELAKAAKDERTRAYHEGQRDIQKQIASTDRKEVGDIKARHFGGKRVVNEEYEEDMPCDCPKCKAKREETPAVNRLWSQFKALFSKLDEAANPTENAFCPTGDGGGQDNSCSSKEGGGEGGSGETKSYSEKLREMTNGKLRKEHAKNDKKFSLESDRAWEKHGPEKKMSELFKLEGDDSALLTALASYERSRYEMGRRRLSNNASIGQVKDEHGKWLPNGAGTGKGPLHKAAKAGYDDRMGFEDDEDTGVEGLEAEDIDFEEAVSNEEDHSGSSVTNVDVFTVLDSLEGEPDMALTTNDRKKLVDGLITNCSCQTANIWKEDDRETLNELKDEKLVALVGNKKALMEASLVINSVLEVGGKDLTVNAMPAFIKEKMKGKKADPKDDEEDDDEDEEKVPVKNQLTKEQIEDIAYARKAKNQRRVEIVNQLTANVSDDDKEATVATLNELPLDKLESLLALAPKPTQNNEGYGTSSPTMYFGAAPVLNRGRSKSYDENDALAIPVTNWEEEGKLINNRKN